MNFKLKIEGDTLSLSVTGVKNLDEMGRVTSIELALLRYYGRHVSQPVKKEPDGTLTYLFHRGDSDHAVYLGAKKVLRGFCVEV